SARAWAEEVAKLRFLASFVWAEAVVAAVRVARSFTTRMI
ncbi:hypothetical protein LCGC14_2076900, partial [marine sediment metagenome]